MKNNSFPYHKDEWNQILEDAFAPNAEPHVFSRTYQQKKCQMNAQLEVSPMKKHNFHVKKPITAAVAIAAAVILVPSTAFAVSHFSAYFQETGAYQQNVVIENSSNDESNTSAQPMALSIGWMPNGMEYIEKDGKYSDAQDRGITLLFWKMDNEAEALTHKISYTVSQETYTCGNNTVLCAKYDTTGHDGGVVFDREIWVAFSGTPYAVQMYVTSDLTDDEMKRVAENLSLTPADTETATEWNNNTENLKEEDLEVTLFDPEKLQVYQIGETVRNSVFDDTDVENAVSVSIDSVSVQDTFDGISTDSCGETRSYDEYTNADGTVADSIRTYYTMGDGVNTLDQETNQETIPQRVLVMHLTYTNIGSETTEECVCPSLFQIQNGDTLVQYKNDADNTYSIDSNDYLKMDSTAFSFFTNHSYRKNNLTSLAPGESAAVTLAFLVDADSMDNLYLNIQPLGHDLADDLNLGSPAIALGDLK